MYLLIFEWLQKQSKIRFIRLFGVINYIRPDNRIAYIIKNMCKIRKSLVIINAPLHASHVDLPT